MGVYRLSSGSMSLSSWCWGPKVVMEANYSASCGNQRNQQTRLHYPPRPLPTPRILPQVPAIVLCVGAQQKPNAADVRNILCVEPNVSDALGQNTERLASRPSDCIGSNPVS